MDYNKKIKKVAEDLWNDDLDDFDEYDETAAQQAKQEIAAEESQLEIDEEHVRKEEEVSRRSRRFNNPDMEEGSKWDKFKI